tara:strand:- start:24 stop:776 length:753 start_codon:yes stop_codon:yes gene_type:complete
MRNNKKPSSLRIFIVIAGVAIINIPIFMFASSFANMSSFNSIILSSLAGIFSAFLIATIVEWTVHRFAMHKSNHLPIFRIATALHHKAHHWVHVTPDQYVNHGQIKRPSIFSSDKTKLCQSSLPRFLTTASHGAFYSFLTSPIILFAWLTTVNIWFTVFMTLTAILLIYLFIRVHDAVHHPGMSRLEYFQWFWFLDNHHYIHHIDNDVNTNFLLPLGDLLMGTLRLELTKEESAKWPSYGKVRSLKLNIK